MVNLPTTQDWQAQDAKSQRYQARRMEVYAAMAEAMDHQVGRLVAHLKATGQYDNTVFLFLSDNGPEGSDYHEAQPWLVFNYKQDTETLGAKGTYGIPGPGWASASATPLYTYKFWAGEGGIRTPMLMAGPPVRRANQIENALTHVTDITPTLLEIAQVPQHAGQYRGSPVEALTGMSLVPLLQGTATTVRKPDQMLGYELSGNSALFKGKLKLLRNMPPLGDGLWHLYDLSKDPGETQDLSMQLPQEFADMQEDFVAWAKANQVLDMPDGYSPQKQVMINGFWRYWLPVHGKTMALILAALMLLPVWLLLRKRKRRL
jgi:arylsulfatase/uncharacterized sulfatase